jgi:hypothetical protein
MDDSDQPKRRTRILIGRWTYGIERYKGYLYADGKMILFAKRKGLKGGALEYLVPPEDRPRTCWQKPVSAFEHLHFSGIMWREMKEERERLLAGRYVVPRKRRS